MVIDDDPDFLDLLSIELRTLGYVFHAHDAEQAIHHLTHRQFDLVVSDWAIAAKTAPEIFIYADSLVVCAVTKSLIKVPVIFISGSEKVEATQRLTRMKNFEAVAFILKSLGPPLIGSMAENVLRRAYATRSMRPAQKAKRHKALGQLCT